MASGGRNCQVAGNDLFLVKQPFVVGLITPSEVDADWAFGPGRCD